jgi:nucleoside 2-deoxyribosyltransferase
MICLVGDILNDVTLASSKTKLKMRLGGIVHAARGLWALGVDYAIAYFAPSYLDSHIESYLSKFGCKKIIKLGNVTNCPYTMLISEVKEVGNQGYEFLLHDDIQIEYDDQALSELSSFKDLMVISGNYDMHRIISKLSPETKIHTDVANNVKNIDEIAFGRKVETLFVSTSSELFHNMFSDAKTFFTELSSLANYIVLKENRGGSRAYESVSERTYNIPSQTLPIQHSVGVGDVYDAVCITAPYEELEDRLTIASWIAKEYASTTFPEDFQNAVKGNLRFSIDQLKASGGCLLPWEDRQKCNIYIAAPDFDFVDTKLIDTLCDSLTYHNFVPRRPIRENGQMSKGASKEEKALLFSKDMSLYTDCNMLIAVLLYNDPGTLIEIGLAAQRGLPTLVYDPKGIADNCMLTELPTLVSNDMDTIMAKVFNEYSKMYANGTL